MKIEPSEFLPIGNEFQKIFGVSFGKFIDMRFLLARKGLVFNLLKFTDWLEERYPDLSSGSLLIRLQRLSIQSSGAD